MGDEFLTYAFLTRCVVSVVLAAGGIFAIIKGCQLYLHGAGLKSDGTEIDAEHGKVKVKARLKTVGSVVMYTSSAWGILSYLSLPTFIGENGSMKIARINTDARVEVASKPEPQSDDDYIAKFTQAIKDNPGVVVAMVDGQTLHTENFDVDRIKIDEFQNAKCFHIDAIADGSTYTMSFKEVLSPDPHGKLIFQLSEKDDGPTAAIAINAKNDQYKKSNTILRAFIGCILAVCYIFTYRGAIKSLR